MKSSSSEFGKGAQHQIKEPRSKVIQREIVVKALKEEDSCLTFFWTAHGIEDAKCDAQDLDWLSVYSNQT